MCLKTSLSTSCGKQFIVNSIANLYYFNFMWINASLDQYIQDL